MKRFTIPIPELKQLEPILTEYFGYRRAMFSNELFSAYKTCYPNGVNENVAVNYQISAPILDEHGVDDGVFDYKRHKPKPASTSTIFDVESFIMDTEHELTISLSNDDMPTNILKLLKKYKLEVDNEVVGVSLLFVAIIYNKYSQKELYTENTISENTLPYLERVRPEMLKLYELLNIKRLVPITKEYEKHLQYIAENKIQIHNLPPIIIDKGKKKRLIRPLCPITIDNGVNKVTLDNSDYWLTNLLDNYLDIYLGVNSLEEAQAELKEKYSQKKGRKTNNMACNLIMYGTFHLLKNHTSLKTKSEQIRMTLDYINLLFEKDNLDKKKDSFNNDVNSANSTIAYLVEKGYKPLWKPKEMEDYNISPNNPSCNNLW